LIEKAPLVAIGIQEEFDSQLSVLEKFPHFSSEAVNKALVSMLAFTQEAQTLTHPKRKPRKRAVT